MPRKSAASTTAASTSPTTAQAGDTSITSHATEPKSPTSKAAKKQQEDSLGIDDLLLPRSLTSRIARGILPANTSIQKDAILALTKSATVFISYLASHANEMTSKKTISPQDVLNAIKEIEMNGVMEIGKVGSDGRKGGRLERELEVYEEGVRGKRKGYREKVKARESGVTEGDKEGEGERGEPQKKKVRRTEENDDADEELLAAQLNGPDSTSGVESPAKDDRPLMNGAHAEDNDETEDDPEIEDDAEEEEEMEEEEEDLLAPDDDEDGEDGQPREDELNDEDDLDGSARRRMILAPNGRAEIGSDDDSD